MSPYALLGLSVLFEVFGDTCMKLSEGFKRKVPIIGIIFWNDPFSIVVGIGMIAVVAGIALLSKGTQEAEEAELACEQG